MKESTESKPDSMMIFLYNCEICVKIMQTSKNIKLLNEKTIICPNLFCRDKKIHRIKRY